MEKLSNGSFSLCSNPWTLVLIPCRANADRNAPRPHPEDHERCVQCSHVEGTAVWSASHRQALSLPGKLAAHPQSVFPADSGTEEGVTGRQKWKELCYQEDRWHPSESSKCWKMFAVPRAQLEARCFSFPPVCGCQISAANGTFSLHTYKFRLCFLKHFLLFQQKKKKSPLLKINLVHFVGKRSVHWQAQNSLTTGWSVGRSSQLNMPGVFLGCVTDLVFNSGWVILLFFIHSFCLLFVCLDSFLWLAFRPCEWSHKFCCRCELSEVPKSALYSLEICLHGRACFGLIWIHQVLLRAWQALLGCHPRSSVQAGAVCPILCSSLGRTLSEWRKRTANSAGTTTRLSITSKIFTQGTSAFMHLSR